ncbi:hypothetical protein LMG23992_04874 [Cupriavidus laharis]|uniref:Uncharacterized protein n=1 Tax=Cupriavidus laharis TaxID=151654 RepID=A0ABM8XRR2_9BURK|nr:hypothetical protein [Cupriavidus laharis]CAG9182977.1 hypothetical protein LMG23992_04874 [Cupriavidus laharis]
MTVEIGNPFEGLVYSSVDVMAFLDAEFKVWRDDHALVNVSSDQFGMARASMYLADLLNGSLTLDGLRAMVDTKRGM